MKKSVWLIIGMCIMLLASFVSATTYFDETFDRASCSGDCWGTPTSKGTDYVYFSSGSADFTIASNSFGYVIDTTTGGDPMAYTTTDLNDDVDLWELNMDWKYSATTNCRFLMKSSDELNSIGFFIENGQYAFYNGTSYNYFGTPTINVWHNIELRVDEILSVGSVYVDNIFIADYNIEKDLNISKLGFGANGGGEICSSYFDNVTINSEVSNNFSIYASNYFNSDTIYNFSALINGTTYYSNVTSGVLITGINASSGLNFSMNISSYNYFNKTYYYNVSNNLNAKLYQSIINISGINTLLNPVSNWTLYNGSTILLNTNSDSGISYLNEGNYNDLSIVSNDGSFASQEVTGFSVNALDNKSVNITIYDFILNITAKNLITSNFIDNFSINIKDLADSSTRNFNTTTGQVLIGIVNSTYNITISSEGYSFYNSSVILELNSSYNYTFQLYTRNSVNISIIDEDTGILINELMSLSFVSSYLSYNFSTTSGTLYEDLLSPNSYAITYSGENYSLRTYYFELINNSYNRINLYTSKLTSQNVTAIVYDKSSVTLEGARIKVKKYSDIYNSFIVNQIAQTNFEGSAGLQLKLLDTFYIFEIYYPYNVLRFESDKTYIYDTTIRFYIDTDSFLVARDYYDVANIYGKLTYETDRFKMVYDNPTGTSYEFCLSVYKSGIMGDSLINSSCATSSGGTIYQGFTPINGSTYYGKATVDFDGENVVLDVLSKSFKTSLTNKNYWLFIVLLMCIMFAFIDYQMSSKMVILTPVPLVFASYIGIININLFITMGIWVAGFVLSLILKSR